MPAERITTAEWTIATLILEYLTVGTKKRDSHRSQKGTNIHIIGTLAQRMLQQVIADAYRSVSISVGGGGGTGGGGEDRGT